MPSVKVYLSALNCHQNLSYLQIQVLEIVEVQSCHILTLELEVSQDHCGICHVGNVEEIHVLLESGLLVAYSVDLVGAVT